jgi:hypothetical protein
MRHCRACRENRAKGYQDVRRQKRIELKLHIAAKLAAMEPLESVEAASDLMWDGLAIE